MRKRERKRKRKEGEREREFFSHVVSLMNLPL
jgi:hypothetical protein